MIIFYMNKKWFKKKYNLTNYDCLTFYDEFDAPLTDEIIEQMKYCRAIHFGLNFNQPIDNLPHYKGNPDDGEYPLGEINTIIIYGHFDHPIDNLPPSITHLYLGIDFNQNVDNLPHGLKHLTFGFLFNKPVDNLPNSLEYLKFGYSFNQKVDNLPNSLTELEFEGNFNNSIDNLPDSIICLKLGLIYSIKINKFPKCLKELYVNGTRVDIQSALQGKFITYRNWIYQ